MARKVAAIAVVIAMIFITPAAFAADDSELILKVLIKKGVITQQEVDEMRAEIAKERALAKVEAPKTVEDRLASVEKDLLSKVGLDKISSKLKIKGRWAAGYFNSQKNGTYPNGSFQAPEAKIQFTFKPDDINDIIMRMNLNNATFNNLDYFYIDTNIMKLTPWEKTIPATLASRLGRFKVDFGEETFSNNPVESVLASNSAANVAGNDEGLMLFGKIGKTRPIGWSAGVYNGNTGTGADNNWLKAYSAKVYYNILDPLYISASYYNSGNLGPVGSEMSIAGITTPVSANTVKWNRQIAEFDIRYDLKKGKTLNPPAYCDSLAYVRAAYGYFIDHGVDNRTDNIREGGYGFVEGLYNVTPKFYLGARASAIGISGEANTASLNSVTANSYERYSFSAGWRMTPATILKGEYSFNREKNGTMGEDPKDDLFSLLIASQF